VPVSKERVYHDQIRLSLIGGVSHAGTISIDFSDIDMSIFDTKKERHTKLWRLTYDVEVLVGAEEGVLLFRVVTNEELIGKTELEYTKDPRSDAALME
jgi:hypothetical protein